ncbi:MAG: hypothetical protein LKK19_02890 [Bacteroidales bacterium]|jgi:hypothetical protein|nr:hypothetical protein [Bacteroidales bacterium]MCI2121632.1 hypothetical protein [Bacteroidales bacterium]MCI2146276.1 hypothetical protein [Bacteroidales bacterium]
MKLRKEDMENTGKISKVRAGARHTGISLLAMAFLAASCVAWSCDRSPAPAVSGSSAISTNDSTWTYYSFESGKTIGESRLMDEEADAAWAARNDWDIAICGDMIRTNGGSSGSAGAAILRDTATSYGNILNAPSEGYISDTQVVVKR